MNETAVPKIHIYFDGACPICTRSVRRLLAFDKEGAFIATSTADPDFDPHQEGLVIEALGKAMQVRDLEGHIHQGLDGILVAWKAVPRLRWLAFMVGLPGIYQAGWVFYRWFARNRYRFARRCDTGSCQT